MRRIFLQMVDFSRNVEFYQKQAELILAFNGSFTLDGRPRQSPPPAPPKKKNKSQTLARKKSQCFTGKNIPSQGNAKTTGSDTTRKHTERHQHQQITSLSFLFIFWAVSQNVQVSSAPSESQHRNLLSFLHPHYCWNKCSQGSKGAQEGVPDQNGMYWRGFFFFAFLKCLFAYTIKTEGDVGWWMWKRSGIYCHLRVRWISKQYAFFSLFFGFGCTSNIKSHNSDKAMIPYCL